MLYLITQDDDCVEAVKAVSSNIGTEVNSHQTIDGIDDFVSKIGDKDVLILDLESFEEQHADKLVAAATSKKDHIILGGGTVNDTIKFYKNFPKVRNVVGKNSKHLKHDIHQALVNMSHSFIPTPLRLISEKKHCTTHTIYDYDKKDRYLSKLEKLASELNCYKLFAPNATTIAWELLMNAIFDASYVSEDLSSLDSIIRTENITLGISDAVNLSYTHDDDRLVVSVKDSFGSLKCEDTIKHLCSIIGDDGLKVNLGEGGAGIGLIMTLNMADSVYFHVEHEVLTEVIAIIYRTKQRKEHRKRKKTLCFYEGETLVSDGLKITAVQDENCLKVKFDGRMNEFADYSPLMIEGITEIQFSFEQVSMMNSIGIQIWLKYVKSIPTGTKILFTECPVHFVEQMNVFAGITGEHKAKVSSCFTPFFCEKCDESHDVLIHLKKTFPDKKTDNFSSIEQRCPACDEVMEFDEIEDSYFDFFDSVDFE